MKRRPLGRTGLTVSEICLGTMTWGSQNTEAEGHAQMDYAVDQGIDFFDTAEMYAVPPNAERYGKTEKIIGTWFAARKNRDKIVLATKVNGRTTADYVRGGKAKLDRANILAAIDTSLKRLQTDYVDLYQLHWPDRPTNYFGKLGYVHEDDPDATPFEETLEALDAIVKAGKVRFVGISNETPWGMMRYLHLAETRGWPRMATIQNPYNFLNRTFEVGLAEAAIREQCGLLAYAPLAAGTLTGKYLDGAMPAGSRRTLDGRGSRYDKPMADTAVRRYLAIAEKHGLDPAQMAIAFCLAQPFMTAPIIGATNMDQLKTDIGAKDITLSAKVLEEIDGVHRDIPNPCP